MADKRSENPGRSACIGRLSDALAMPVIAVAAGWQGDSRVNLDHEAERVFLDVLDSELHGGDRQPDEVALFLVGRGGRPGFADGVRRALAGRHLATTAVVPHRIDGALSLVAIGGQRRLMHPYGALGAYDRGALGQVGGTESLADHVLARTVDETGASEIRRIRQAMSTAALGDQLGLSANGVDALGLVAAQVDVQLAEIVWQLYQSYEAAFDIRGRPTPRYTESDIADEVEFSPATSLVAAFIEGRHQSWGFEVDTARPDPDTSLFDGEWRRE